MALGVSSGFCLRILHREKDFPGEQTEEGKA
jgi:hypothetical protein